MCDDKPTQRATQRFDDGSQTLRDIGKALALRRPKMHRIEASLRESGGVVGLQPFQRLTLPRAEIDFTQRGFNFEWRLRRDDLARFQAASHWTNQGALKVEGLQLDLKLPALFDAQGAQWHVGSGEKASREVAFRNAVPAKDDCAQARFMKRCVRAKSKRS